MGSRGSSSKANGGPPPVPAPAPKPTPQPQPQPTKKPKDDNEPTRQDFQNFETTFERLDRSIAYVPIANLRKETGLSREKFSNILRTLRDRGKIRVYNSDLRWVSAKEWKDSYIDENGFTVRRQTWNDWM